MHALMLFSEETTMLGYASDHIEINWFPTGFYIIEQGEPATKLYLVLSGQVNVVRETADGELLPITTLGPGAFFGEEGLFHNQPRNAHVIAEESVTCLVFSPSESTQFAGRGEGALLGADAGDALNQDSTGAATTCIDVVEFVPQKMKAMSAHRTQFPLEPDMLPLPLLEEMFGHEYFIRVYPPAILETELI